MRSLTRIYIFTLVVLVRKGDGFNEAIFHRRTGKYLANRVLRTERTTSEFECGTHCSIEAKCASVNYKISGDNQGLCELNNASLTDSTSQESHNSEYTYLGIVRRSCKEGLQVFSQETKQCIPTKETSRYKSCKEIFEAGTSNDGLYYLDDHLSEQQYPVYCKMIAIPGCGGGGWTLVMKIDGIKQTFAYNSPYWSDKRTYRESDGLDGITEKESKSKSYWNTPFTKICLGMKVNGETKWISLDYPAPSMYSVIAGGTYQETNAGRATWKSLIEGSSLQPNCNKEGFNFSYKQQILIRIGIAANNQNNCHSCDSWIGFGVSFEGCYEKPEITCGNVALCSGTDNGTKRTTAFGYLLVQ